MAELSQLLAKAWQLREKIRWEPQPQWGLSLRQADALFEKSQNESVEFPFRGNHRDTKM